MPAGQSQSAENDQAVDLDLTRVRQVQEQLQRLGFNPGPADGIVGKRTTAAVKRFKQVHCLPSSGRISSVFLTHLEKTAGESSHLKVAERKKVPTSPPPGADTIEAGHPATPGAAKSMPSYKTRTLFVYSNGSVERVVDVKGSVVRWARQDETRYTADRNILLPWSFWNSGGSQRKIAIVGDPRSLWPGQPGSQVTFQAKVTEYSETDGAVTLERHDDWSCKNLGPEAVTVSSGTFDAVKLVCERASAASGPNLVRTWFYSDLVGHYVRRTERHLRTGVRQAVDLVAVVPSPSDWPPFVRAGLARALRLALESETQRKSVRWKSTGVSTTVTIRVEPKFLDKHGQQCRRFTQIWQDHGRRRLYPAVACKNNAAKWGIPGMGNGNILAFNPKVR